jgi:hypothetical protein
MRRCGDTFRAGLTARGAGKLTQRTKTASIRTIDAVFLSDRCRGSAPGNLTQFLGDIS